MLVVNDTHLGVVRTGGTTPQSQQALRDYLRTSLASLLAEHRGEHVVFNGDTFDSFQVETCELIGAYEILAEHLKDGQLTMIMGNHDASAKGSKISSFHLLCHFLKVLSPERFRMVDNNDGFCNVQGNVWSISHCLNQSLFDMELDKAVASDGVGQYLLLHCNYKNGFAENSDHSLNINDDQVGKLMIAGWTLVLGHEHIGYELRGGRVKVVGNQFPSSVADCLGNKEKNALFIDGDGSRYVNTWKSEQTFAEVNWQELLSDNPVPFANFYRITGDATAAQAAEVIGAVSKFRQRCVSDVFVVTNAVKIEGAEAFAEMAEVGAAGVKSFDVLAAIFENLDEKEVECVKGLI